MVDQVAAGHDLDAVWVLFFGSKIHNDVCVRRESVRGMYWTSSGVITKMALVPTILILLSPRHIPPKSFSKFAMFLQLQGRSSVFIA